MGGKESQRCLTPPAPHRHGLQRVYLKLCLLVHVDCWQRRLCSCSPAPTHGKPPDALTPPPFRPHQCDASSSAGGEAAGPPALVGAHTKWRPTKGHVGHWQPLQDCPRGVPAVQVRRSGPGLPPGVWLRLARLRLSHAQHQHSLQGRQEGTVGLRSWTPGGLWGGGHSHAGTLGAEPALPVRG